jgi:hypothetical protein
MYFQSGWDRYKRSTCLDGQQVIEQLWACTSEELARSVYDGGMHGTYTEPALLTAMEKLTVRAQNKLVNVVSFLGMSQDSEETAGSFAARLSLTSPSSVPTPHASRTTATWTTW